MIADVAQRWRRGRALYRPAGEPIATRLHEVAAIPDDRTAKSFVVAHHYAASYPAARFRFGLYRGAALVGVAVFSVPANPAVLARFGEVDAVELGRFVLLDQVASNGESWMLARCFDLLRLQGIAGVVSFSDPVAGTALDGTRTFCGHIGTIYQATNATYLGRSKAETRRLLPDGTIFHGRAAAKIRRRDVGWRYAAALLERHGAAPLGDEDGAAWLRTWVPRLTRPLRHDGNHRYAFGLDRRLRKHLGESLPYPKFDLDRRAA
jgi:hypothetical protein